MRQKEKQREKADGLCLLVIRKLPEEARQWKWKEHTYKKNRKDSGIGREGRQRESSDAPHSCCGLLK